MVKRYETDCFHRGIGAEYFLIGTLHRLGYDACKLPVDFGIDVIATNLKRCVHGFRNANGEIEQDSNLVYKHIQVKSAFLENSEKASESLARFYISDKDISAVRKSESGYFVFYFFDPQANEVPVLSFWLRAEDLVQLKKGGRLLRKKCDEGDKAKQCLELLVKWPEKPGSSTPDIMVMTEKGEPLKKPYSYANDYRFTIEKLMAGG